MIACNNNNMPFSVYNVLGYGVTHATFVARYHPLLLPAKMDFAMVVLQ